MGHQDQALTEAESIEYIKQLYELEGNPDTPRAAITMGPFTAFVVIGALQLAIYPGPASTRSGRTPRNARPAATSDSPR